MRKNFVGTEWAGGDRSPPLGSQEQFPEAKNNDHSLEEADKYMLCIRHAKVVNSWKLRINKVPEGENN